MTCATDHMGKSRLLKPDATPGSLAQPSDHLVSVACQPPGPKLCAPITTGPSTPPAALVASLARSATVAPSITTASRARRATAPVWGGYAPTASRATVAANVSRALKALNATRASRRAAACPRATCSHSRHSTSSSNRSGLLSPHVINSHCCPSSHSSNSLHITVRHTAPFCRSQALHTSHRLSSSRHTDITRPSLTLSSSRLSHLARLTPRCGKCRGSGALSASPVAAAIPPPAMTASLARGVCASKTTSDPTVSRAIVWAPSNARTVRDPSGAV